MNLDDNELINTIKKQNKIDTVNMRIMKRMVKVKNNDQRRGNEEGSIIMEVDEETHEMILQKTKLNSLIAHKDEIQHQIMKKINPAFLALSETRLTEDIEDSEVNVSGYNMTRCNAENRNTGGVVLYVRNDIIYETVSVQKLESNCWCVAVEVKDKLYKGVIMVIYHLPSASHGDFMRFFEDIVEELIIKGECMVIGDFNIDLMTDSFYAKKVQTAMLSLGMKQYVNEPTRITKDIQTIIDLIFANSNKRVQVIHEPKITDHAWLEVELSVNKIENKYREFSARNYKEFDEEDQSTGAGKRIIYAIENMETMENFEGITVEHLEKIIKGLPNKKGTEEGITSDILKATFCVIKEEFVDIINNSLRDGCCPESWKTSTIISIPKVDKAKKASEFRPINVLLIFEKVLELVVKEQIERYLENNSIIIEHQSGFRKHYSCETAIQTIVDEWKLIVSERRMVGVIFMDLKRAFETIDRERLLGKLYRYGIRGKVLEWLNSYLKNRTQQVRFNNK
ncbi:uncharacterized protein LOC105423786 [Pogonomyrmex barbatus]|uniref:Uncharacterized protein LOC105423786 n=1 Tax=Pogonomyrmex barbatus TaxID=144034 RepID=A0A6I9VST3_9HYME|nr:uncharacterized protein LOC105423786 [Pogonomyrmex barbatus]